MMMWKRSLLAIVPIFLIIALPLCLRKPAEQIDLSADQLVIVSPHNEAIRFEFEQGFRRYYQEQTGRKVSIDWRATGGTSEIVRYVNSAFTASFRHYWINELGKSWSDEVEQAYGNRRLRPEDAGYEAREAFLASNVGIGIDLFFGGGQYDLHKQAQIGTLVPCGLRERQPELFAGAEPLLPWGMGGEVWADKNDCYYGVCFSSFGICQNLDRLRALGYDVQGDVGPLRTWRDLADTRLLGHIGLADPSKSGSINKCFEMLVQREMQDRMAALAGELASGAISQPQALDLAWQDAMTLIKEIGGNAAYLTFSASQVPMDTARGQIAAGMCIDFYGRGQAEWEERHVGRKTMVYHTPDAGSSVSADPIGLFRGAPNAERAKMFIDYVMSVDGQRLWNYLPGTPGGPQKYSLQRLPARRDMYGAEHRQYMSAPKAAPYELAGAFTYQGAWTGPLFDILRTTIRVMVIDCQDELRAAWRAIVAAGGPAAVPEAMAAFRELPYEHHEARDASQLLQEAESQTRTTRDWALFFRDSYARAQDLAIQGK
ncbi:MAG: ABC transporter substrate-binding protein [Lentisphaeria bacterium]|jgi:iron(III) transport system substrate-binding protein